MAIDTSLLIAAPMLQDYFVDKSTGDPLSAGVITCYQDNSRTTLKNWYYQSGVAGNYSYIPLPNPMTLSAVGTIVDDNGNDTIPFFYPYSESDRNTLQTYYITVDNSNGQRQFVRQNFPFVPPETPAGTSVPTLKNYIVNNNFWRNIGSMTLTNVTDTVVAPSCHDGFSMPDLHFIKNVTGAAETVTFTKFALGSDPLNNDITPEFYLDHECTAPEAGETLKVYQYPIVLHVKNLESTQAVFTIQAQNVGGNTNNYLDIFIYQFLGTGVTSPDPIFQARLSLTDSWQKHIVPFTFPSAAGATLGSGGDDAYYLQIGIPLTVTSHIYFTVPSIYLNQNALSVPTNNFETYDETDTIINSPRTGDVRTSLNSFYPYGWVPVNGGNIGNASSNATTRANVDTFPLFSLMWNAFAKYTSGTTNIIAQMVNSSGISVAYGASAIDDFSANNAIYLTQSMSRIIMGTAPESALLSGWKTTGTFSNNAGSLLMTTINSVNLFEGTPITFTNVGGSLPTGLTAGVIYFVVNFNGSNAFEIATTYTNAIAKSAIAYTNSGSGTTTVTITITGVQIGEYEHTQTVAELAQHHHAAPSGNFITSSSVTFGVVGGHGAGDSGDANTQDTGSNTPFNIVQVSTYYNIFMKL